ncbi:toll/interleukin-1 receptor domain-containing protein [Bradyrhizobium sp. S3.9.1]|uniref:toll/interleukin-1 receptor domain-containing protein n=1 Tax=Bradyrhizobium sp. S3.9.1 TaxID=3156431 RepID=UPI003398963B
MDDISSAFISYHHADRDIGDEISKVLFQLASHGKGKKSLKVFLDVAGIPSGQPWQPIIDKGLEESDWLIVVFTGDQSVYCGYEIGTFSQQHNGKFGGSSPQKFLLSLYDVNQDLTPLPTILRPYQNTFVDSVADPTGLHDKVVVSAEEVDFWFNSSLGQFLVRFCTYKEVYLPTDDAADYAGRIALGAKRIANAFSRERGKDVKSETPAPLAFELFLRKAEKEISSIPANAVVQGTTLFFDVFGLSLPRARDQAPNITWEEFNRALKVNGVQVPWLHKIEADVLRAIQNLSPSGDDVTFRSPANKIYLSILIRHKLFGNGDRTFEFLMVETLDRRFIGSPRSSLLLIGLILASRWRFTYFENWSETTSRLFGGEVALSDFASACRQLIYNIDWIEHESAEFGLANPKNLIDAFGDQRRARVEQFFKDWTDAKAKLQLVLPGLDTEITPANRSAISDAILTFLRETRDQNGAFLKLAIEAYANEIDSGLKSSSALH